ncbi:hypothetical protein FISHEDRAFT_38182 [Fistulina hepatica ATCC 64428]|nr:hypothetical protein FISHEDRAFT_38182 [Fistulina hepatica ATCC 64428]
MEVPNIWTGYLTIAFTIAFFLISSYAVIFGFFLPESGWTVLDWLAADTHYKYLIVFLIPTGSYFVIANWVGWQYYIHA